MAETYSFKKKKQIKDANAVRKFYSSGIFLGFFITLGSLGFVYGWICGGFWGAVGYFLVGLGISLAAVFVAGLLSEDLTSKLSSALFLGGRPNWTIRERLASDIQMTTHDKNNHDFSRALARVDGILKQDPKFPEALYLKAEILWEGFGKTNEAMDILKKIMTFTKSSDQYHTWARTLHQKLSHYR